MIYTPVFHQPHVIGAMPGTTTRLWRHADVPRARCVRVLRIYDGNLGRGEQTD